LGTRRAAFIRTQIALSQLPDYDPLCVSTRQLHPDYLTGWCMTDALPKKLPAGYRWNHFEFRRGFPWKIGVHSAEAFGEDGAEIFDIAPIQALYLSSHFSQDGMSLASWKHLERIRRLEFSFGLLGPDELNELTTSPHACNLTELAIGEFEGITSKGLDTLSRSALFSQLTSLEIRSAVVPSPLLLDAFSAVREGSELSKLVLSGINLRHAEAESLFGLPVLQNLHSLDLSDNPRFGTPGLQILAQSGLLGGLRQLNLAQTRTGLAGVRDLVESTHLTNLRSLDLSWNRLGPATGLVIAVSPAAANLRVLRLSNNPLRDIGVQALAASPAFAGLLELDLCDTDLSDAGAMALAASPHLEGLLRLDLRNHTNERALSGRTRRALVERFGQRVSC
jgi:hypothetical protein